MLQRSDVQMDCAKNGSHLASVKLRGNRNSCRLSGTRMAGLGDMWTGFVVLVMIGVCAQTVSGIDVYPNNDGRWRTVTTYFYLCCAISVFFFCRKIPSIFNIFASQQR